MKQEKSLGRLKKKILIRYFPWKCPGKKALKNSIKDKERKTKEEEQNPKTKFITEFDSSLSLVV